MTKEGRNKKEAYTYLEEGRFKLIMTTSTCHQKQPYIVHNHINHVMLIVKRKAVFAGNVGNMKW